MVIQTANEQISTWIQAVRKDDHLRKIFSLILRLLRRGVKRYHSIFLLQSGPNILLYLLTI